MDESLLNVISNQQMQQPINVTVRAWLYKTYVFYGPDLLCLHV